MNVRFWLPLSLIFTFVTFAKAQATMDQITFENEVLLENVRKKAEDKKAVLFDQYAAAVKRLQNKFQQDGDLDNALMAEEEFRLATENKRFGKTDFPGIATMRETLKSSLRDIDLAARTNREALQKSYHSSLDTLVADLTKAGNIDEAVKIKAVVDKLRATAGWTPNADVAKTPAPEMATKITLVNEPGGKSILDADKAFNTQESIKSGVYSGFSPVVIGDRSAEKGKQKGSLTIPPGTEISNARIYFDLGPLNISGSMARQIEFQCNLGGDLFADDVIFDRCTFAKAGGWFSGVSSRWRFNNSVIHETFFPRWSKKLTGIQAKYTTFENVEFESFEYREDAGKEATDKWSIYERCLFRDCEIPESVLIQTKACVFEDCTFKTDSDFPVKTPLTITIYHRGIRHSLPTDRTDVTYLQRPEADLDGAVVGSQLSYRISDGMIRLPE